MLNVELSLRDFEFFNVEFFSFIEFFNVEFFHLLNFSTIEFFNY